MDINQLETEVHSIISGIDAPIGLVIKERNHSINVNENMPMPAASVIKIPIIMEAFRQAEIGDLILSETLNIPAEAKVGGSGVLQTMSKDVSITLLDVLTLMITVSDNTASNLALERVGISNVNRLCRELEHHNTEIQRYFMDTKAAEKGLENMTTAIDMVNFLEEIASPQLLNQDSANRILQIMSQQQLTSKLPAYHIIDDVMIANKTGELVNAEHDVAIFQYKGRTLFAAVMVNEVSDQVEAQQTIANIGKEVMAYLTR
ncbi:beta-lactamase class A [Lentibacillus halodurans]|uniref:Beta-lactamase class A n=1 Tax=Lentibacillus halodurans TaxID=237679 RepID=A0A1I0W4M4_9BACI|nr:serine hydrolase [Lentibacillus halodurans]SFA83622.1 beta-lactamase class A [Lentibacillus halodurans]